MKTDHSSLQESRGQPLVVNDPFGTGKPVTTGLGAPGVVHVELQGMWLTFTVELFDPWRAGRVTISLQALRSLGMPTVHAVRAWIGDMVVIELESLVKMMRLSFPMGAEHAVKDDRPWDLHELRYKVEVW